MLHQISDSRLEELRGRYRLTDYRPFQVEEEKLQKLRAKKSLLSETIDKLSLELETAKSEHTKIYLAALLDESKEKAAALSSNKLDKLREDLANAENLRNGVDDLIAGMLPDYQIAKEKAISELKVRAKKDHQVIAKSMYKVLQQLSQIQLQEQEFRYAVTSCGGWLSGISHVNLYNHAVMNDIGDEKKDNSPFNNWVKLMKNNGYTL